MAPPNYEKEYEKHLNLAKKLIWKIKDKTAVQAFCAGHAIDFALEKVRRVRSILAGCDIAVRLEGLELNHPAWKLFGSATGGSNFMQMGAYVVNSGQRRSVRCANRAIALKYVNLITHLNSDDIIVKKNRNAFFEYFLRVLEDQLNVEAKTKIECTCPIQNKELLSDPLKFLQKEVINSGEKVVCNWSKDKRSYISAKILPGRGALLYMAVSSNGSEWDVRGQQKKG